MLKLLNEIKDCKVCEKHLKDGVNPVIHINNKSKIIIIGQAPGRIVHKSGIPWNDKSGDNLRNWLSVSDEKFYNKDIFGIMPMGFCFPGSSKNGDLPPRKECAPLWHNRVFNSLNEIKLILLIGQYAQKYYLNDKLSLTERVKNYKNYLPEFLPLPHPSPRNKLWIAKNKWFEVDLLPELKEIVNKLT